MEPIKILIVDDDKDFCTCIGDMIKLHPQMELTGIAHNGEDAYQKATSLHPDLILLDNCMPLLDGIGVIERLQTLQPHPYIFTMSAWDIEQMIPEHLQKDITYAIKKPIEWELLSKRILHLIEKENHEETEQRHRISLLLEEFEIPVHTNGHQLLQEALLLIYREKEAVKNLSGLLYPKIAHQFNISIKTTERKIQYELDRIFTYENSPRIQRIFYKTSPSKGKLTNKQFLMLLAQELGYL